MQSATFTSGEAVTANKINAFREDIATLAGDFATTTGSADAYLLALDAQITAYRTGMVIKFIASFANAGACTINVNSLGAKKLLTQNNRELRSGTLLEDCIYTAIYEGTNFIVIGVNDDTIKHTFVARPSTQSIFSTFEKADGLKLICQYSASVVAETARAVVGNKWTPFPTSGAGTYTAYNCFALYNDSGTEYLLGTDSGASKFKRYALGTGTGTDLTLSGAAPSSYTARRCYSASDGYIYQMNVDNGTQVRRYSISGTTITNIASDITLSEIPSGSIYSMFADDDYLYFYVNVSSSLYLKKYDKTTGVLVEAVLLGYSYSSYFIFGRDKRLYQSIYVDGMWKEFLPLDLPL